MRKLPASINILSEVYTIIEEPEPFISDNEVLRGHVNYPDRVIRVYCPNYEAALKTLFHEIHHVICRELNLYDNTHNEHFIDTFAVGLVDTLLRNNLISGV